MMRPIIRSNNDLLPTTINNMNQ